MKAFDVLVIDHPIGPMLLFLPIHLNLHDRERTQGGQFFSSYSLLTKKTPRKVWGYVTVDRYEST